MNNLAVMALFGLPLLSAFSASATTLDFTNGTTNSNLTSYTVTSGSLTATVTAFYATGPSTGPNGSTSVPTSNFFAGQVGEYNGAGLGVCKSQSVPGIPTCTSPNHQIDNGTNLSITNNAGSSTDFEFALIAFSTPVDLNFIQLGNFGTTGSTVDPFLATYYTSGSGLSSAAIQAALTATTASGLAGIDGFSAPKQTTCTAAGIFNCAVNGLANESLTGSSVKYLLFGASDVAGNAGTDFFKIQTLTVSAPVVTTPEPATFGLFAGVLAGLGVAGRKLKSRKAESIS